jgi:hypothetical protein
VWGGYLLVGDRIGFDDTCILPISFLDKLSGRGDFTVDDLRYYVLRDTEYVNTYHQPSGSSRRGRGETHQRHYRLIPVLGLSCCLIPYRSRSDSLQLSRQLPPQASKPVVYSTNKEDLSISKQTDSPEVN